MIDDGLLFRVEESDDSDEDAFEDDGPALVCSCTLGGPTVVIEAKTDNKKEELSVEEEGFQDQDQEHHDKDRADNPFQEENGRGGESDGKVVRFEVKRETNIYHHHS